LAGTLPSPLKALGQRGWVWGGLVIEDVKGRMSTVSEGMALGRLRRRGDPKGEEAGGKKLLMVWKIADGKAGMKIGIGPPFTEKSWKKRREWDR